MIKCPEFAVRDLLVKRFTNEEKDVHKCAKSLKKLNKSKIIKYFLTHLCI